MHTTPTYFDLAGHGTFFLQADGLPSDGIYAATPCCQMAARIASDGNGSYCAMCYKALPEWCAYGAQVNDGPGLEALIRHTARRNQCDEPWQCVTNLLWKAEVSG